MENNCCKEKEEEKECFNVLSSLLRSVLFIYSNGNQGATLTQLLTAGLNSGYVLKACDGCCPDCVSKHGLYFLGNPQSFVQLITDMTTIEGFVENFNCCINYSGNITDAAAIKQKIDSLTNKISCCSTLLTEDVLSLSESIDGLSATLNQGLVEVSSISGESQIIKLKEYALSFYPNISDSELVEIYTVILDGIVVVCTENSVILTNSSNILSILNL